jgi:hypothetical protein
MYNTDEYKNLRASNLGKKLIAQSQADAASSFFDLQSGSINKDATQTLTPYDIYMAVSMASGFEFEVSGVSYQLTPYYNHETKESLLAQFQDLQTAIENSLFKAILELQPDSFE